MKFSVGQNVDFKKNSSVFGNNVKILGIQPDVSGKNIYYVIENSQFGWTPDGFRVQKFKLDPKKKYLFATESELFAPGENKKQSDKKEATLRERKSASEEKRTSLSVKAVSSPKKSAKKKKKR